MYLDYFGFKEFPFSIAPDPKFLFLSERHKEALAHLLFGVKGQGGFILLTGEVGTGKTTVCRSFLDQLPEDTDVAYIVNPKLSSRELLATICDELSIEGFETGKMYSAKHYTDAINKYLLSAHAQGRHTVLIIDEAQNLSVEVLEQIRLLTNLETAEKKLLQIILLGQPELKQLVAREDLRQLTQRITARYHLEALDREELEAYVRFRLQVAGRPAPVFSKTALRVLYRLSGGVPRLVNLIADRALLAAYASEENVVSPKLIWSAAEETTGVSSVGRFFAFLGLSKLGNSEKSNQPYKQMALIGVGAAAVAVSLMVVIKLFKSEVEITQPAQVVSQFENVTDLNSHSPEKHQVVPDSEKIHANLFSIDQLSNQLILDESTVNNRLLELWQQSKENADLSSTKSYCYSLEFLGMLCSNMKGSWRQVLNVNLPVVLTLRMPGRGEFEVLLESIKDETAVIATSNGSRTMLASDLQQHWYGHFRFIWQAPSYRSSVIVPGAPSVKEEWLEQSLNKIELDLLERNTDIGKKWPVGGSLKAKIKYFQMISGLEPDGIAGEQTEVKISALLDSNVPKLVDSQLL